MIKKLLLKRSQNNPKNSWNQLLSWLYLQQNEYEKALIQEKALFKRNFQGICPDIWLAVVGTEMRREDFQTRNGMPRLKTAHLKTNFRRRNEDSSNEINAESVAVREESPGPVVIQGSIRGMGRGRKKKFINQK